MNCDREYESRFIAMIKRHERVIFSVCFFYACADVPFDDLRQEVLISLFKSFPSFKNCSSEATWVYRVAINTCLFSLRKNHRSIKTVPFQDFSTGQFMDEDDSEHRERLEWLHEAMADLAPLDKAIIVMWLDDLSYDEIAANIGIPRNTVASRLHRIKEKLSSKKDI